MGFWPGEHPHYIVSLSECQYNIWGLPQGERKERSSKYDEFTHFRHIFPFVFHIKKYFRKRFPHAHHKFSTASRGRFSIRLSCLWAFFQQKKGTKRLHGYGKYYTRVTDPKDLGPRSAHSSSLRSGRRVHKKYVGKSSRLQTNMSEQICIKRPKKCTQK